MHMYSKTMVPDAVHICYNTCTRCDHHKFKHQTPPPQKRLLETKRWCQIRIIHTSWVITDAYSHDHNVHNPEISSLSISSPCLEVIIATFGYIHSKGSFLFHKAFTRSGSSVRHLRQFYIVYGLHVCSRTPQVQGWKTHKTTNTRVSRLKLLVDPFPLHCNLGRSCIWFSSGWACTLALTSVI